MAETHHEQVVRILLTQKDINPNSVAVLHTRPLFQAAKNGDIGIVKLLLGKKEVNPYIEDHSYRQIPV